MRITALAILSLLALNAAAQNEQSLDPITVTATLQPQKAATTGRNITTISGAMFNSLPVQSLDDLLKYIPGIEVQQRGPAGSQADIVIRGGTFQQVLVILDGMRLNDPNTGHFSSYIPISPAEIDHIEILKGAASAIYGSEAVGGVVHIITKIFAAKQNKERKEFAATGTGGQFGLWSINAGGIVQNRNNSIAGGVLTNNADGQLQRGTRGFFHNTTASLSASHYFNEHWKLSLRASYDTRHFSAQNFYTTYASDTATEKVQTYWNQLTLGYENGKNKWVTGAGYKKAIDEYAFNSGGSPNRNISSLSQITSRYEHQFTAATTLISGLQFQDKAVASNDRGNHELDQLAAFIILNQSFGSHFFISPAIRADYTQNSGTELVPQINLSYKLKSIQLRGSAGKTIRQADFTERFNNYNKALVTSGSIGNPNLQAERSFSYEAGADFFIGKEWKIASTIFRRDQSQMIDWVTTPYSSMPRKDNLIPTGTYALATNIASVNTTGAETDIQYNRSFKGHRQLFSSLGILWLDDHSSNAQPSFYISSHAKFLANFSVLYSSPWFSVSLNGIYKERTPQTAGSINAAVSRDYCIMNIKAEHFIKVHRASIFIEAQNLFNKNYSDLLGAPMPGRWLSGGLTVQFQKKASQ